MSLSESADYGWHGDVQLLCFSAMVPDDLIRTVQDWELPESWLALCNECARSRDAFAADHLNRLVITIDRKKADLTELLARAKASISTDQPESGQTPDGIFWGTGSPLGKLALLFPGQGSQYVDMLVDLRNRFPSMDEAIAAADRVFSNFDSSRSLSSRLFSSGDDPIDADELKSTEVAQPAIGAISMGLYNLLKRFSVPADMVGGHSYGELTALCAADSYDEETFYQMSNVRGQLMAVKGERPGAMLAIRSSAEASDDLIREGKLDLVIANRNAPEQTVLSGPVEEIQRCWELLRAKEIPGKILDVSAAFHSAWIAHAQKPFAEALAKFSFSVPKIPVYANSTAREYPDSAAEVKDILVEQIAKPVRFVEQIRNMFGDGARTFLQVGPSNQLTNLTSAILKDDKHEAIAIDSSHGSRSNEVDLARSLGKVAALGHTIDLTQWNPMDAADNPIQVSRAATGQPLTEAQMGTLDAAPAAASTTSTTPDTPATPPVSNPESDENLAAALQQTQRNILALQATQARVADLHQEFLENQREAQRNLQALIQGHQNLLDGTALPDAILPIPKPPALSVVEGGRLSIPEQPAPSVVEEAVQQSPAQATSPDGQCYAAQLLDIVAETTGYPIDMLNLEMSLDADLGIDSIKRVEILSALQEQLPGVPAVPTEQLGAIQTLADILTALGESAATTAAPPAADVENRSEELTTAVLDVVHETTGYPIDMLDMSMDLNADLGIDSIKRMEIFSAVSERFPDLPAIPTEQLGEIRTLSDIVTLLDSAGPSAAAPASPTVAEVSSDAAEPALKTFALTAQEAEAPPRKSLALAAGAAIMVTSDNGVLDQAIVAELEARDFRATIVDTNAALDVPPDLHGLIVLAPTGELADSFHQSVFALLQAVEPTLCANGDNGTAILAAVSRMDGIFGLHHLNGSSRTAVSGGLAGLIKSARFEWPDVDCKAIDVDADFAPANLASQIVDEVLSETPIEIGISDRGRFVPELSAPELVPAVDPSVLSAGDIVVVSGGARGVTAATALSIAQTWQPTLLLLGRSPLPEAEAEWLGALETEAEIKQAIVDQADSALKPRDVQDRYTTIMRGREIHQNIAAIEAAGSTVLYRSVDVRDSAALSDIISDVRATGPIRGLVHGAGILADRRIADKTAAQFEAVYSTKVTGLFNLLDILTDDELRFIGIFSSMTGRFGRIGQIDYSIANEIVNKVAQIEARKRPACTVRSFNWGPWDSGMVTEGLKKQFAAEGIAVIPRDAGPEFLVSELCAAPAQAVELIVLGGDSTIAL
jgi:acyl transferase domain-containing protein